MITSKKIGNRFEPKISAKVVFKLDLYSVWSKACTSVSVFPMALD